MGMNTHVIIGHFLKAESDISAIVCSDKFEDTIVDSGGEYYFSNHGNTVFCWDKYNSQDKYFEINDSIVAEKLELFKQEIKDITGILDLLGIKWHILYGAKTWCN